MINLNKLSTMFARLDYVMSKHTVTTVSGLRIRADVINMGANVSLTCFKLKIRFSADGIEDEIYMDADPDSMNTTAWENDLLDAMKEFAELVKANAKEVR